MRYSKATPLGETHILAVLTHLWFAAVKLLGWRSKNVYEEIDYAHVREAANEAMKFLFPDLLENWNDYSRWEVPGAALVTTTQPIRFPPSKGPCGDDRGCNTRH
jgi:hypothetical protein